MKSDDYLKEIEQHRQKIQLEENGEERIRSRKELRRNGRNKGAKKTSKRKSNALLTTVFGIFILIPVAILIYVSVFYEPDASDSASMDNQLKIEVNTPEQNVASETDGQDDVVEDEEPQSGEKDQPDPVASQEDDSQPPVEERTEPAEEPQEQETPVTQERTHTVAPGETLFRIAMNYYGSPDGIDKIKEANGLSSNEISAGQILQIP